MGCSGSSEECPPHFLNLDLFYDRASWQFTLLKSNYLLNWCTNLLTKLAFWQVKYGVYLHFADNHRR